MSSLNESWIDMKETTNGQTTIEFDFDYWMKLAKNDPDAFEKERQNLILETIEEAPERIQRRLNGLQWSIDGRIKTAKNPMDGCLTVYQMMMDSVYEEGGLLEALNMSVDAVRGNSEKNVLQMTNTKKIEE